MSKAAFLFKDHPNINSKTRNAHLEIKLLDTIISGNAALERLLLSGQNPTIMKITEFISAVCIIIVMALRQKDRLKNEFVSAFPHL